MMGGIGDTKSSPNLETTPVVRSHDDLGVFKTALDAMAALDALAALDLQTMLLD
jgi:hypothetical protein